jgi:hypothetical protein
MKTVTEMMGHNRPPLAELLSEAHADLAASVAALVAGAAALPLPITSDSEAGRVGDFAAKVSKTLKAVEEARKAEKEPPLRWGKEVDAYFAALTAPADEVRKAITAQQSAYLVAKQAEERRQREELAAALAAEAERKAKEAADIAAADAAFGITTGTGTIAAAEAEVIAKASLTAAKAAGATVADLSRTRGVSGSVTSLRTTWAFEIVDAGKVPLEALRPYLDVEGAVRRYVAAGGRELEGVSIFEKHTAITRA